MSVSASAVKTDRDRYAPPGVARLAVAWRNPGTRSIRPVGLLSWNGSVYRFAYLRRAVAEPEFRPLLGFPSLERTYESSALFPLFAQRVMSPRRPDYRSYLAALDLESSVTPWEVMARSEGRREGDSVLLFPEPLVSCGESVAKVLVHGVRHLIEVDSRVEESLRRLRVGDELSLVADVANTVNPKAILVADSQDIHLGYIPDLLLGYLDELRRNGYVQIEVSRINPPSVSPHMRLLIEVNGSVASDYIPFSGADWECFGQH